MTSITQPEEVKALLAAWEEFDLGLRFRQGCSNSAWERLRAALRDCESNWRGSSTVPRVAANIMVDMFASTEANAGIYDGDVRKRVQDAAFELQDLVRACVAVDEGDY